MAVSRIGALSRICGRDCVNSLVLSQSGEHGPTLTGIHIEDHLIIFLVGLHIVNYFLKLISEDCSAASWHLQDARRAMVSVEDEDLTLFVRIEHWFATRSLGVTFEDSVEIGSCDVLSFVVDFGGIVYVGAILGVKKFALYRVGVCQRDVIIGHVNDLLLWNSILAQ